MATDEKPSKKKTPLLHKFRVDTFLMELLSKVGIVGTVIVSCIYIFIKCGTQAQKEEFIDNFLLLKILKNDEHYVYFTVLCGVLFYLITIFYYSNRLKLKDERIKYLTEDLAKCEKIKKK
jgi:hypothetical protein